MIMKWVLNFIGLSNYDNGEIKISDDLLANLDSLDVPGWKCLNCKSKNVLLAAASKLGTFYCPNCTHIEEKDVMPL